ncbi:MAG TPA: tetratricopeptide repeat protein [Anaerolineaceae bacterium]|nr:tetratricopeptide repeat protein [Anaerolineaceae bacterium]
MKDSIQLTGRQPNFRKPKSSSSIILLTLLVLVTGSIFLLRGIFTKEIKSPFEDTPIPTRTSSSYALEGETQFNAGNMAEAINAFQKATQDDPKNIQLWSELARIQTYSSATLATDSVRRTRLQDALASINTAVKIADDDSTVHAIKAFVLDWNANPVLAGDQSQNYYTEGEQEALRALQLDANNTLAYAYYAEILVDQQKWDQAQKEIQIALNRNEPLMDVYRVSAVVQESLGNYNAAIEQYLKAVAITPNLTFLYVYIGYNYRVLRQLDRALDYFTKAVEINKRLNLSDPIPYLAIGKTYVDKGEFFAAALNVRAALNKNPSNPDVYGNLGVVYFKSRNYEGSIPALKCSVTGCDAQTSCEVRTGDVCQDPNNPAIVITGLPLSSNTVVYYYTYASVLAAMDQPSSPKCPDAIPILQQIRKSFSNDASIMSIIKPSEQICGVTQISN